MIVLSPCTVIIMGRGRIDLHIGQLAENQQGCKEKRTSANGQILAEDAKKLKRGFLHSIAEPTVL